MLKTDAFSGMICSWLVSTVHPFSRPQGSRVLCDVRGSAGGNKGMESQCHGNASMPHGSVQEFSGNWEAGNLGIRIQRFVRVQWIGPRNLPSRWDFTFLTVGGGG